jgi:uncharacterized membrane protein YgcG
MKRAIRSLLLAAAVMCVSFGAAFGLSAAGHAQNFYEQIVSYDTSIDIQSSGSILVTEKIVYDFGAFERHGIFREIPVRFRYNSRYDRIYPLHVRSVSSPDAPDQYKVTSDGPYTVIKIGDPDQTITGQHEYTITYLVRGSLNSFADHDELYWNAVGDQWGVPIERATVHVTAPAPITRARCFSGAYASTRPCQRLDVADGAGFRQVNLNPYEGMTVAVAMPKGVVTPPHPILKERWSLQRAFALTPVSGGAFAGMLAIVVIAGALVLTRGRGRRYSRSAAHVTGGTPTPGEEAVPLSGRDQPAMEPEPPPGVRPGQAGTLLDGVANARDVTATIADLAVRGYLRIEDVPYRQTKAADWRLVRLEKTGGLMDYEWILLNGLFHGALAPAEIQLSELGADFAETLKQAQDALYTDVAKRGWFTARPDSVRKKWLAIGGVTFVIGVVATVVAAASSHLALVPIPLALAGLALMGFARRMPMRTAAGTLLVRQLLGFRRYIMTAVPDQASAAGQPGVLYDYLPYAIVFGCTREWADLTESLARADYTPAWYRGIGPDPASRLHTMSRSGYYFSSMHNFAMVADDKIANSVSASGGSGFSGGGGSSGGGGGGGGGGSW